MTSHPLGVDSSEHDLIIGSSFNKTNNTAFHSMRFDFKPASVDPSQPSVIEVSDNNNITVHVPHIEQGVNKGQTHTIYKGNKRPVQKDCVLIIDHETGDITLEKLSYNIALKKTRGERTTPLVAPQQLPRITSDIKKLKNKKKAVPKKENKDKESGSQKDVTPTTSTSSTPTPPPVPSPVTLPTAPSPAPIPTAPSPASLPASNATVDFDTDSDSSSSSSDSDDESPVKPQPTLAKPSASSLPPNPQPNTSHQSTYMTTLTEDLLLSESGSDSD